jgi:hypothetical protein
VFGLYHPENSFHNAAIYLVARGRPPANNARYGSPDMAVAIHPNADRVKDRTPLRPQFPLPWKDAYYWSFGASISHARILSRPLDQQHLNRIDVDEEWRLMDHLDEDESAIRKSGQSKIVVLGLLHSMTGKGGEASLVAISACEVASETVPVPPKTEKNKTDEQTSLPVSASNPVEELPARLTFSDQRAPSEGDLSSTGLSHLTNL